MQVPVVFYGTYGGEIFRVRVSSNMAIYSIEMTKLEVGYIQVVLNFSVRMISSQNLRLNKAPFIFSVS